MAEDNRDTSEADKPPGICCPRCGCRDLRVQNTRQSNGFIKRWRVCRHCDRRIVTQEKIIGQPLPAPRINEYGDEFSS